MAKVKEYKYKRNVFVCATPSCPKSEVKSEKVSERISLNDAEYLKYVSKAFESLMDDLRHMEYLGKDEVLGPAVKDGKIVNIVTYTPEPDNRSRSFWMFGVYSPNGNGQSLEEAISKYEELVKKKD